MEDITVESLELFVRMNPKIDVRCYCSREMCTPSSPPTAECVLANTAVEGASTVSPWDLFMGGAFGLDDRVATYQRLCLLVNWLALTAALRCTALH